MQNPGEELVGEYLKAICGCDFVEYNLHTRDIQGEIDVVGVNTKKKTIYVCEVAIHLETGLQYTKDGKPNNVNKLLEKFAKDIEYAKKYFEKYEMHFMLWSPIVKSRKPQAKYDQLKDIEEIRSRLRDEFGVELEAIINQEYKDCLSKLREYASKETKELRSPILRLMQIEEKLSKHIRRLDGNQ